MARPLFKITAARLSQSIHQPVRDLTGGLILPDQVGHSIIIDIKDTDDFPVGSMPAPLFRITAAGLSHSIHQPVRDLTGDLILPDEIGLAVTIEITAADDLPVRVNAQAVIQITAARLSHSVHQPVRELTGGLILPDDIGFAVAVEITDADDFPVRVNGLRRYSENRRWTDVSSVHQPVRELTGGLILPDEIGFAVSVEIADADDLPVRVNGRRRYSA